MLRSRAPHKYLRLARWAALCLFASIAGCAIFGGGSEITHAKGAKVQPPSGWRDTDKDDSDRAYRLASGSVATFTSSCKRDTKAPLEILTKQLLMGTRNVKIVHQEPVKIKDADGLHSSVKATVDGVPFHLDLFVLKQAGCIFDFTLMNPGSLGSRDIEEFTAFVKSFEYGTN